MPDLSQCDPFGGATCGSDRSCNSDGFSVGSLIPNVVVKPRVIGETLVTWDFRSEKAKPPVRFRLEFSQSSHGEGTVWEPVSDFAEDTFAAIDSRSRSAGWYRLAYYRVLAIDADGNWFKSDPVPANQTFKQKQHESLFREIVRREQLRARRRNTEMSIGALLKVRYYGEPCGTCRDPNTELSINHDCPDCFGRGYRLGYYHPYPCFAVDLGGGQHDLKMFEEQGPRVDDSPRVMRFLNMPQVHPWDIWVDYSSDYRYLIGQIQAITTIGSLDVICNAAVSRIEFTDPAYKVPVYADQNPALFFAKKP